MGEREKIATGYAGEDFVGGYAVIAAEPLFGRKRNV